jgi:hypothetical protein
VGQNVLLGQNTTFDCVLGLAAGVADFGLARVQVDVRAANAGFEERLRHVVG